MTVHYATVVLLVYFMLSSHHSQSLFSSFHNDVFNFVFLDCTNCILDCTNWLDCTLRI